MEMEPQLSRELTDLAMVLMKVIKAEFRADASAGVPTLTQFRMLHFIRKGESRVGRLAEEFGISQPAASIMVDAMVQEGLLARTPDRDDRRQIVLRLTAKAESRMEAIRGRALAKIDARLEGLPAAGRRDLARRVREVAALLSAPEREAA
jgi:DNA-binding MarR family transcriptional regulator